MSDSNSESGYDELPSGQADFLPNLLQNLQSLSTSHPELSPYGTVPGISEAHNVHQRDESSLETAQKDLEARIKPMIDSDIADLGKHYSAQLNDAPEKTIEGLVDQVLVDKHAISDLRQSQDYGGASSADFRQLRQNYETVVEDRNKIMRERDELQALAARTRATLPPTSPENSAFQLASYRELTRQMVGLPPDSEYDWAAFYTMQSEALRISTTIHTNQLLAGTGSVMPGLALHAQV